MIKLGLRNLSCVVLALTCDVLSYGHSAAGTIHGMVLDPSGAAVKGAVVSILNPVSHYQESAVTDGQGAFEFDNVPYNNYHLTAAAGGFQTASQDVNLRSAIPMELKISLEIGAEKTTMTVTDSADLLETVSTTHTDVD